MTKEVELLKGHKFGPDEIRPPKLAAVFVSVGWTLFRLKVLPADFGNAPQLQFLVAFW